METLLGIDEAGRGSVIGPLVVGGFLVRADQLDALRATGAKDSKALSPARRDAVYARLGTVGRRWTVLLTPKEIDRYVARGGLNELEARAFARLVRRARPDRALVDACDANADRFGRAVEGFAGGTVPVFARHHADRDDVLVGAASIVAKVSRDRAIARLQARIGTPVGSGYPSDPTTVAHLRAHAATGAPFPDYVRRSWATTKRVKRAVRAPPLEAFER